MCCGDSHAAFLIRQRSSRRAPRERKNFPTDSTTNEANNKNGRFPNLCAISGISVPNYYLNYKSRICIGKGQGAACSPQEPVLRDGVCVSKAHFRFIAASCASKKKSQKEKSLFRRSQGDFYIWRQSYGARR